MVTRVDETGALDQQVNHSKRWVGTQQPSQFQLLTCGSDGGDECHIFLDEPQPSENCDHRSPGMNEEMF